MNYVGVLERWKRRHSKKERDAATMPVVVPVRAGSKVRTFDPEFEHKKVRRHMARASRRANRS